MIGLALFIVNCKLRAIIRETLGLWGGLLEELLFVLRLADVRGFLHSVIMKRYLVALLKKHESHLRGPDYREGALEQTC